MVFRYKLKILLTRHSYHKQCKMVLGTRYKVFLAGQSYHEQCKLVLGTSYKVMTTGESYYRQYKMVLGTRYKVLLAGQSYHEQCKMVLGKKSCYICKVFMLLIYFYILKLILKSICSLYYCLLTILLSKNIMYQYYISAFVSK